MKERETQFMQFEQFEQSPEILDDVSNRLG